MVNRYIKTNLQQYITEKYNNLQFTEEQMIIAHNLFKELFDFYLKNMSPKTYPMIYHCTSFSNYESIKKSGLTKKRNYFMGWDNDLNTYGGDDYGNDVPGIACAVNYKDVIDRLFPDPEWMPLFGILGKTGNPSKYKTNKIDDRIIFCLLVTDILDLDLSKSLSIKDVNRKKLNYILDEAMFSWLYVKGVVSPDLIDIKINSDLL